MRIRKAAPGDYAACAALEQAILELHQRNRPDFFRERAAALTEERFQALLEQAVFLVAEEDGTVVGHCFAGKRGYEGHPGFNNIEWLEIDDIVVDEKHRGEGVGTELFEAMKAEAARMGFKHIELTVWGFNEEARRFYEKLGMTCRIERLEIDV